MITVTRGWLRSNKVYTTRGATSRKTLPGGASWRTRSSSWQRYTSISKATWQSWRLATPSMYIKGSSWNRINSSKLKTNSKSTYQKLTLCFIYQSLVRLPNLSNQCATLIESWARALYAIGVLSAVLIFRALTLSTKTTVVLMLLWSRKARLEDTDTKSWREMSSKCFIWTSGSSYVWCATHLTDSRSCRRFTTLISASISKRWRILIARAITTRWSIQSTDSTRQRSDLSER